MYYSAKLNTFIWSLIHCLPILKTETLLEDTPRANQLFYVIKEYFGYIL